MKIQNKLAMDENVLTISDVRPIPDRAGCNLMLSTYRGDNDTWEWQYSPDITNYKPDTLYEAMVQALEGLKKRFIKIQMDHPVLSIKTLPRKEALAAEQEGRDRHDYTWLHVLGWGHLGGKDCRFCK